MSSEICIDRMFLKGNFCCYENAKFPSLFIVIRLQNISYFYQKYKHNHAFMFSGRYCRPLKPNLEFLDRSP